MSSNDLSIPNKEKSLATSLREIRKRLNLTQEDFARLMNVRVRTVSRWETGETEPTMTIREFKYFLEVLNQAGLSLNDLSEN